MRESPKFSPGVQERAVRMVLEHQGEHGSQWAAIESIAGKMRRAAETLPVRARKHDGRITLTRSKQR